nr:hypothetical protein [Planctomycetota bacterium]
MTPDERTKVEAAAEKSLAVRRVADAAAQARVRRRLVVAGVALLVAVAVGAVVIGGMALV